MKAKLISFVFACIAIIVLSGFVFAGWSVSPTNYYFANVPFGETRDAQFTVHNGGPGYSGGGAVTISADIPQVWSCVSGCSYWIGPGEDHTVTIRFTSSQCPSADHCNGGATINFPTNSGTINGWIGVSVTGS